MQMQLRQTLQVSEIPQVPFWRNLVAVHPILALSIIALRNGATVNLHESVHQRHV